MSYLLFGKSTKMKVLDSNGRKFFLNWMMRMMK